MARVKHMNAYILQKKSPKTQVPEKQEIMLNLKSYRNFAFEMECSDFNSYLSNSLI